MKKVINIFVEFYRLFLILICFIIPRKRYIGTYEFQYLDPKSGRISVFKQRYDGNGFSSNGALKSAIKQFCKKNKFIGTSSTIVSIKKV